ncbi:MAG: hypothetical protein GY819_15605 [Planctomycetaceae bacterium]|nr:hypothetical protein [Planctomycetaceae bacterium]MCP4464217.1 hypothetical protein [Planctomycetaceae bacterium]MDG1809536.1 hypothetical protein [Pirellulaceae bacterium]MDG2102426.1 hypothetical protein [Pirellulaceae bacterium]
MNSIKVAFVSFLIMCTVFVGYRYYSSAEPKMKIRTEGSIWDNWSLFSQEAESPTPT